MKIFTAITIVIAFGLIIFNATKIDFNAPFQGESIVAIITIVASLCVVLIMTILNVSKRIEQKVKGRN